MCIVCDKLASLITADYASVQAKAAEIFRSGGVRMVTLNQDYAEFNVTSTTGKNYMVLLGFTENLGIAGDPKDKLKSWTCSCFLPDAPILMADGTEKPISKIHVGDMVITHLGNIKRIAQVKNRPHKGELIIIQADGLSREIMATADHPLRSINTITGAFIWTAIGGLKLGDWICSSKWHQITSITQTEYNGDVWNLEVEDDHSYRAYGVVVHNCDWGKWNYDRSAPWAYLEGRICSHGLAALYQVWSLVYHAQPMLQG